MSNDQSPQSPKPSKNKPNSPFQPKPLSQSEQLARLAANNTVLAETLDANAQVLKDGLEVTEARQWMIMKAMDDQVLPSGPKLAKDANGIPTGVDWEHYKNEFLEYAKSLQVGAEAQPPKEDESGIPAEAAVFGG